MKPPTDFRWLFYLSVQFFFKAICDRFAFFGAEYRIQQIPTFTGNDGVFDFRQFIAAVTGVPVLLFKGKIAADLGDAFFYFGCIF